MVRDALLVAGKDVRIELRSRVGLNQIVPFGLLVLVLFAFALDPDAGILERATPGLFWVAVLFVALQVVQRTFAVEAADGNTDALRLSGLDPAGVFLGKAGFLAAMLLVLEVAMGAGVVLLYGAEPQGWALLVVSSLGATVGLAAVGTIYGALSAGARVRDTLLPLLLLPVAAPVLIGSTRAFEAALHGPASEGWPWAALLAAIAVVYLAVGIAGFGSLLEEA